MGQTTFDCLLDAWKQACTASHVIETNLSTRHRDNCLVHLVREQSNWSFDSNVSHDKRKGVLSESLHITHSCTEHGQKSRGTAIIVPFVEAQVCTQNIVC
jgi:hypothetical protein